MHIGYVILIGICLIALLVLMGDIKRVNDNQERLLRIVCIVLFTFSMTRYLTLIVYGDSPSIGQLEVLRYFYLATSIGLTIPTVSAIWYVSPYLREKLAYGKYLLFFIPWMIVYTGIIVLQPTEIVAGSTYGYQLVLTGMGPTILAIAQGSLEVVIFSLCLYGLAKYKNPAIRSQYLTILLVQIPLILDGVSYYLPVRGFFPPFTVSEVFAFMGLYYAFGVPVRKLKK